MKCRKKSYEVTIVEVKPGIVFTNYLEGNEYVSTEERNMLVTGTLGEQWLITKDKMDRTYVNIRNNVYETLNNGDEYYCKKAVGNEVVKTSWNDALTANRPNVPHGDGDWVLSTKKDFSNDCWIVNGLVFERTYETKED